MPRNEFHGNMRSWRAHPKPAVRAPDRNGDGLADLLVGMRDRFGVPFIALVPGTPTGTLGEPRRIEGFAWDDAAPLRVGDVDGDAYDDALLVMSRCQDPPPSHTQTLVIFGAPGGAPRRQQALRVGR